jgi:hypothetical protein
MTTPSTAKYLASRIDELCKSLEKTAEVEA